MNNIIDKNFEDGSYDRMMEFANNHRPQGNFGNLYLIKSINKDGNITGEYYGMNVFTDVGMREYFINKSSFPSKLFVGQGTGSITYSSGGERMNEQIPSVTDALTNSNTTITYNYPLYYKRNYYSDGTGLITAMCRRMISYLDYNITGKTSDFSITEYGIGTDINTLWTHSHVYDINGNSTYVTKKPNERLEFTVYLCFSYYDKLITDGYDGVYIDDGVMKKNNTVESAVINPRFTMITTMNLFFNRMWDSKIYTYKRNNIIYDIGASSRPVSIFTNNEITQTTTATEVTITKGSSDNQGYIDGFIQWHDGYLSLEPQQLDTAEDISITNLYSNDPSTPYGFAYKFGNKNNYSFSQIDVKKVYLFNHKTNDWTNECDFYNDKNHWYDETNMGGTLALPLYYTNNNQQIMTVYVQENLRTDDPIVSVNPTIVTLYVTDEYWDKSTWVHITNYLNIPQELRTKRYWITDGTNDIKPVRESDEFHLVIKGTTDSGYATFSSFSTTYGCRSICSNYEYGWYMHENTVYVPSESNPNNRYSFTIGVSGDGDETTSLTYGKWLITFNNDSSMDNKFYLTDMSDLSTQPVPVVKEFTNLSTNCRFISQAYRTQTDTGLICIQSLTGDDCIVLDLRDNGYVEKSLNAKMSTAIWGSNRIAYIPSSDTSVVRIREYTSSSADVDMGITFTLPTTLTMSSTIMFGHTNYVWISDGTNAYMLNISNGSIVTCTDKISFATTNRHQLKITAVDDVILIYNHRTGSSVNNARYVVINDPSNILNLSPLNIENNSSYYGSQIEFTLKYIQQTTLVLAMSRWYSSSSSYSGSHNYVLDFGQYLNDGSIYKWDKDENNYTALIVYGEYVIDLIKNKTPMLSYLPTKLEGKTYTIGTENKLKHISDKQFSITFTNVPTFGTGPSDGVPPGVRN